MMGVIGQPGKKRRRREKPKAKSCYKGKPFKSVEIYQCDSYNKSDKKITVEREK